MAIIRINKNIFSDESQEKQVESGKTIEECLCDFNNPVFNKGSVEVYDCETGETTYAEISDDDEYLNAVIIVNGEDKGLDYVIKENDIVSVTFYPGNGDTGTIWKNIGLAVAGVALIAGGIALSVWSGGSLTGVGLELAKYGGMFIGLAGAGLVATSVMGFVSGDFLPSTIWDYLTKKLNDGSNSSGKSLKQIPNVRNAKNETIIGNTIPFVMGTQQVAPFIIGSPFYDISGDRGTVQYITLLYCVGYAPLKLTDFKLSNIYLARNQDVTSGDHDTVMHGMLRGYSDTTGDIEDKWRYNDVSLEILQKGDDYGTLYNKKIIAESINAYVLHIYDTALSEIQYGGTELASGYRTNTVRFTQSCPYEISVELYLASGFYRTRSESSDSSSKVVYDTMPCWVSIQYRFYKDDTETYNSAEYYQGDKIYDGGWKDFTSINDGFITLSDYTSSARSEETSAHTGDSIDENYNDGWIGGKAFNLSPLEDKTGSGVTQIRLVASHTFTVQECAEIAGIIKDSSGNKYADLTTLQVRVVRLSPQYCAQESSGSSSVGTWSYVESIKWNYLTSKCFDNDKLSDYYKTNGTLPSSIDDYVLRPCNSTNLNNACYVALKVKSDSAGEIASELDKLSVTAESFAPKYNDTDKTWYPEIVTNVKKYYGAPVYNSTLGKYEMGAELTESQYIADRQSGVKAIEYDAGSNMISQMKNEIFSSSTSVVPLSFIFTGHESDINHNIYIYNSYSRQTITKSLSGYSYRGICYDGTYIYASAYEGNTVSVIDKSSFSVKKTISVGTQPSRCHYDGTYVYVSNINSDNISVINPKTLTVVKTIGVGNAPVEMCSNGGLLYVSNQGDSTVSVISNTSLSIIETIFAGSHPYGICHDGTYLYVVVEPEGTNTFSTLRVYNHPYLLYTLVSSSDILPVLSYCLYIDGSYIYATGYNAKTITKLSSGANPAVISSLSINNYPKSICSDNYYIYVSGGGNLVTIDKNSFTEVSTTGGSSNSEQCTIIPDYKPSFYILSDAMNTKYVTNNPASMFLLATCGILLKRESLEYYSQNKDAYGNIAIGDINMQSCTEAYQFCEDVTDGSTYEEGDAEYVSGSTNIRHMKFGCNGYIYNATKLDNILSNICICARGVYTIDNIMRLTMVVDKANDCSVGIINQSNCIDASNSISFADIPSGYKMSYPNEDDGYQEDVLYAMDDGEDYTNPLKEITDLTLKYVTNTYQSWSLARYCLGSAKINKEVITRTMGAAGYSVMIGDVMDVQDLNILIGTDHGGHIQSLIEDDDYIYGFICDNTFEYTGETNTSGLCIQGVKILQPTQWQSSRVISVRMATTAGITETDGTIVIPTIGTTNQVVFAVKIVKDTGKPYDDPASVITYLPESGDIVAFGEVDEITAQYKISKITHTDKNQFQLYLVTYNKDIYNYGAKLPSYNSHLNKPASISDITNLDFTVTQKDVEKAAANASNIANSSVNTIVISASTGVIIRSADDSLSPATVTFNGHVKAYDSTLSDYSGRFIIAESTDGITFSKTDESTADESSHEYTPTTSALLVKASLYEAGGFTSLYDSETVGIVSNQSGYTAWIENDTLTFSADSTGTISAEQTETSIIKAYKGIASKAFTVGTIPSVSGITVSNDSGTLTIVAATGTAMADNGTITIPITYTDDSFQMNLVIRYTKIKTGATGATGVTIALTADNTVFNYDTAPSPTSATVTATLHNHSGTVYYNFYVDGESVQNTMSNVYTYTPKTLYADMPQNIIVRVRNGSTAGDVIAIDSLDMYGVKNGVDGTNGLDGMTFTQQNASQSVPADSSGTVSSYTGTGNTIRVFEGSTELQAVTGTPTAEQYKVVAAGTDITAGAVSISGKTSVVAVSSAMTAGTSTLRATVTYTITGVRANGTAFSTTLTQSITKAVAGANLGGNIIVADPSSTTPESTMEYNKTYYNITNGVTYQWSWTSPTTGIWSQVSAEYPTNIAVRYSFDEIPDLPDDSGNVSGDVVANLRNYTVTGDKNLWTCIASGTDPYLRISKTGLGLTAPFILCYDVFVSALNGNTSTSEGYMFNTDGTYTEISSQLITPSSTEWKSCRILLTPTSGKTVSYIRLDLITDASSVTSTVLLKNIYIGDGTTTQPIIDNMSGSVNATGSGVVSVPGVSGKACQFLGLKAIQLDLSKYANAQSWEISVWVNLSDEEFVNYKAIFQAGGKEVIQCRTGGLICFSYNGSIYSASALIPKSSLINGWHLITVQTIINSSSSALKKLYLDNILFSSVSYFIVKFC